MVIFGSYLQYIFITATFVFHWRINFWCKLGYFLWRLPETHKEKAHYHSSSLHSPFTLMWRWQAVQHRWAQSFTPIKQVNSPVWILRWVQQLDTAPLMDINVSPTACFANQGYRHICGFKLAKKIVGESLTKDCIHILPHEIMSVNEKRPAMSVCIVWERMDLFLSCGFNFLTVNHCDLRLFFFELSSLFMKRQSTCRLSHTVWSWLMEMQRIINASKYS